MRPNDSKQRRRVRGLKARDAVVYGVPQGKSFFLRKRYVGGGG